MSQKRTVLEIIVLKDEKYIKGTELVSFLKMSCLKEIKFNTHKQLAAQN